MILFLITLLVISIISSLEIELNIDNTIWQNRKTKEFICVTQIDSDNRVNYKYINDDFIRYMSIGTLLVNFKYDGE